MFHSTLFAKERFRRSWPVMGTYAELEIDHDSPVLRKQGESLVRQVFRRVNRTMSTYSAQSDLMRINRSGYRNFVRVDPWVIDLLKKSKRFAEISEGAFSIDVLGYGIKLGLKPGDLDAYHLPPHGESYLELRNTPPSAKLERPGMGLDLGGIAKGYALDRVVTTLKAEGIERFFVSLGRSIYAGNAPRNSEGWPVKIQGRDQVRRVEKQFWSVSEQGLRSDTGHIIDPRTGQSISRRGRVVAIGTRGWLVDASSTALFVEPTLRTKLIRHFDDLQHVIILSP